MAGNPADDSAEAARQYIDDVRELTALIETENHRPLTEEEGRRKVELYRRIADYHRERPAE